MAYTTYEHMVFKAYYVDDCEKQKVISNIKKIISASTIEFGMLQICKNQVLCEIDNEQKLNCKMNKICCKKYSEFSPLGKKDDVKRINEDDIINFLNNKYYSADKNLFLIESEGMYGAKINNLLISCEKSNKDNTNWIIQYLFYDLIFIILEWLKKNKARFDYIIQNIDGKKYLWIKNSIYKKSIKSILTNKDKYLYALEAIRNIYENEHEFNIGNLVQIVIDSAFTYNVPFNMSELKEILYNYNAKVLYEKYCDFIKNIEIY